MRGDLPGNGRQLSSDTASVVDLVHGARVVALGEGAHNIENFLDIRNWLLHLLVTQLGFTAIVTESGFAEGLAVDDFVMGGPGDPMTVARHAISYRFGECTPAVEQLRWMRRHNTNRGARNPVHWYGMDLPGDSTSPQEALRVCLARIPAASGDDDLLRRADFGRRAQASARWAALPGDERDRLYAGIADVVRRTLAQGDTVARHCARSLVAFVEESRCASDDGAMWARDAFMAETVLWALERHDRILMCAHNAHVRRTPQDGRPMAGSALSGYLGAEFRSIGQTYGAGPEVRFRNRSDRAFDWDVELIEHHPAPGTLAFELERTFADSSAPEHIIASADLPSSLSEEATRAFDAVIHHRRVRHVAGAFARLREDVADV